MAHRQCLRFEVRSQGSLFLNRYIRCGRCPETRPAGTAIEFLLRREQRFAAADAVVAARLCVLVVRVRVRDFGAMFARDVVLLRRQLFAPLAVGFADLWLGCCVAHGALVRSVVLVLLWGRRRLSSSLDG